MDDQRDYAEEAENRRLMDEDVCPVLEWRQGEQLPCGLERPCPRHDPHANSVQSAIQNGE